MLQGQRLAAVAATARAKDWFKRHAPYSIRFIYVGLLPNGQLHDVMQPTDSASWGLQPLSVEEGQFDLFGSPGEPGALATPLVESAMMSDDWSQLDARMPAQLYLGASSWSFLGWAGTIYDRQRPATGLARHGLAAYANFGPLRTVCIDRGYYGPIPVSEFRAYAQAVPADFRFVVKADSAVTASSLRSSDSWHANPHFLDAEYAARHVVEPCIQGLGDKGGILLFQIPPMAVEIRRKPPQFSERLSEFITALPGGPMYAIELRDADLMGPWFARAVRQSGAQHCIGLHPRMPPLLKQRSLMAAASDGPLIVRWNLHPNQRYEEARNRYAPFDQLVDEDRPTRNALAKLCRESLASRRKVFMSANHKAEGSAPLSLLELGRGITNRTISYSTRPVVALQNLFFITARRLRLCLSYITRPTHVQEEFCGYSKNWRSPTNSTQCHSVWMR